MRFALVSDIHANLPAWDAVLEDISGLEIDQIINLGDIVGYGPSPREVLASVRKHASVSVIGNHDAVCANRMDSSIFNDRAHTVIEWTQQLLDEESSGFLAGLPETTRPDGAGFLITHAEVVEPFNFGYILTTEDAAENFAACEDSIIFFGHTHFPGVFMQNESGAVSLHEAGTFTCDPAQRYIINPGSVGDPRSADIVASYCIYDSETRVVEFRRVAFDIDAYRTIFSNSGLTTKPYFIRYLDDTTEASTQALIPSVSESDGVPQINLGVTMPVVKTPLKKKPALLSGIIVLLIAVGAIAWFVITEYSKAPQTEKNTVAAKDETQKAPATKPVPKVAKKFPVTARYLRVSNPKGEYLSLAEVQVFSKGKNIALRKKATQSSDFIKKMHAAIATDGNTQGNKIGYYTHTKDTRPIWWEVDLGKEYPISKVILWNRNESKSLLKRLDGFTLEAFDGKRRLIYQTKNNPGNETTIQIK